MEYGSSRSIGDNCVLDGLDDRVFVWFAGRSSNKQSGDASYCELERVNKGLLKEGCLIQIGTSQFIFKLQNPEESISLGQNLVVAKNARSTLDEFRSA